MIKRFWRWLTDPNAQGRKRTIAAIAIFLVGLIKAIGAAVAYACTNALLAGTVCSLDFGAYAAAVEAVDKFIQTVVVQGASMSAVAFAAWGLIDAWRKQRARADYVSPRP